MSKAPSQHREFRLLYPKHKAAGASHDSPRAQTCTFQGPGIQKHHQNSTKGPLREGTKERKMWWESKKRAKFWAVRRRAVRKRAVRRRRVWWKVGRTHKTQHTAHTAHNTLHTRQHSRQHKTTHKTTQHHTTQHIKTGLALTLINKSDILPAQTKQVRTC